MKLIIKVTVAIVLIAVLVQGVDWNQARELISAVTWWTLAVILAAMILEILISAWKWSWSLQMHGLGFSLNHLVRAIATGMFLNNFLPTSLGGDAYRVYRTLPQDGYRSRAVSAVAVERVVGLGALLTLGGLGAVTLVRESGAAGLYILTLSGGGLAALLLVYAVYRGWFKPITNRIRHLAMFDAIDHNLGRLISARREWIYVLALSFAFQFVSILIVYWIFQQVGYPVPLAPCALVTAAAGVIAVLPFSINGIGLMEGSFVGMAVGLGISYDYAVLVVIIRRLMMIALSVLCGLVYLLDTKAPSPQTST